MARKYGSGSIYRRGRDGMWCWSIELGRVEGVRKRKVIARRELSDLRAELDRLGIDPDAQDAPPPGRSDHMESARALGRHTDAEWYALIRRSPKQCRYCDVPLHLFNTVKDHKTPVSRGGSDSIDNLEPICWECNASKGSKTAEEYSYSGERPRTFRPSPKYRATYDRLEARHG